MTAYNDIRFLTEFYSKFATICEVRNKLYEYSMLVKKHELFDRRISTDYWRKEFLPWFNLLELSDRMKRTLTAVFSIWFREDIKDAN